MEFSDEFFQSFVELLKAATKDLQDMRNAWPQSQPLPIPLDCEVLTPTISEICEPLPDFPPYFVGNKMCRPDCDLINGLAGAPQERKKPE